jgi:hypothetical protein
MSKVRRKGDDVVVTLTSEERQLLASLATAICTLLERDGDTVDDDPLAALVGMSSEPVVAPDDPVLRRLLPDAYGDPELAAEFRQLTDADLRARKASALRRVLDDVTGDDTVALDEDEGVGMWVQGINDVRLVLGTRLDVTEDWTDSFDTLPPDDPRIPLYLFYDWLSSLQDALVRAAMRG